jgi:hypothetical protein
MREFRRKQVDSQSALCDIWTETCHEFTSGDGVPINPDSMMALMANTISTQRRFGPTRRRCQQGRVSKGQS